MRKLMSLAIGLALITGCASTPKVQPQPKADYVTKAQLLETLNDFGQWLMENGYLVDPTTPEQTPEY